MLYDWLKEIDFAQPLVFAQFAWIPVLIWWYVKKYNRKQATIKVSTVAGFYCFFWLKTGFVICLLF